MTENLEAERVAKEATAKEKIMALVEEMKDDIANEELSRYFYPDAIAEGVLRTPGKNLEEKASNYFKFEWLRVMEGGIADMQPELQTEATDRVRYLARQVELAMREIEK